MSENSEIKSFIQPFEVELAKLEYEALLARGERGRSARLIDRLGYYESVGGVPTRQALREATTNIARSQIPTGQLRKHLPLGKDLPFVKRRTLRYATHGIHEYRGKFFPQLVRSLLNIGGAKRGSLVLDPMCGSGTTLVEGVLSGCQVVGLDLNPLSAMIAKDKCSLLAADPDELIQDFEQIRSTLESQAAKPRFGYLDQLTESEREYLDSWFEAETLRELDGIATHLTDRLPAPAVSLAWISLSNILRSSSQQKTDDLRVRRDYSVQEMPDIRGRFLREFERSIRLTAAFLYQEGRQNGPSYEVHLADARDLHNFSGKRKVDLIITSPPYATALPYLDTDRLSLSFLGLESRADVRKRDRDMIGNREVTERHRQLLWNEYLALQHELPDSVRRLLELLHSRLDHESTGFRRRNLPALLSKYFLDMRLVLSRSKDTLKPGHSAFFIVGNNHTMSGGERVEIRTAELLGEVAESVGFAWTKTISMEMLVARDAHQSNSLASEFILEFEAPA